ALVSHIWNNIQPWVHEDIRSVLERMPLSVREGPFIGMHIRRGDKIREAPPVETKVYLETALAYMTACSYEGDLPEECDERRTPSPAEIRAIYLASDDKDVEKEVRELAPNFFKSDIDIVFASAGIKGFDLAHKTPTTTQHQTYWTQLFFLVDVEQLVNADLFVGTFSSNAGRLIYLLRKHV
ncbi:unnamed protein product, partial [Choristocarpus tenellus]